MTCSLQVYNSIKKEIRHRCSIYFVEQCEWALLNLPYCIPFLVKYIKTPELLPNPDVSMCETDTMRTANNKYILIVFFSLSKIVIKCLSVLTFTTSSNWRVMLMYHVMYRCIRGDKVLFNYKISDDLFVISRITRLR